MPETMRVLFFSAVALLALPTAFGFVSAPKPALATFHAHAAVIPQRSSSLSVRMAAIKNLAEEVQPLLKKADEKILDRTIRIANHLPVLGSLLYFGLISMKSMMGAVPQASNVVISAITSYVGPTSARAFSDKFPTLVTPARYVFYIWPIISAVQLVTVGISALEPKKEALLSQNNLSALLLANIAATWWIVTSSNAVGAVPPLASFLILPLVPLFSGYPTRTISRTTSENAANKVESRNLIFQIYSSFTTLASLLALTVELQHGGRVPFVGGRPEVAAAIFLLSGYAAVSLPGQSVVRKWVYAGTIGGIFWKRVAAAMVTGVSGLTSALFSVSFLGTAALALIAAKNLIDEYRKD